MKKIGWCLFLLPALLAACKSEPVVVEKSPVIAAESPVAAEKSPVIAEESLITAEEPPVEAEPVVEQANEPEPHSDSIRISQEMYEKTLGEVRVFVDNLNKVISSKDYNGWKDALSDELFARISSPEFLAKASQSSLLRAKKIVLKTPTDYFLQVVVPARSNSKVDAIEFMDKNRVKVYYLEERVRRTDNNVSVTETRRLRLYDLIEIGDTWKILD